MIRLLGTSAPPLERLAEALCLYPRGVVETTKEWSLASLFVADMARPNVQLSRDTSP